MQCVNCQFENMPGTPACVRCGTSLGLATAVISIAPPRATKLQKELRRWIPFWQMYYPLQNRLASAFQRATAAVARDLAIHLPAFGTWTRMIVPGWAHLHEGHTRTGRGFLGVWLAALFVTVLGYGSSMGAVAVGILFATHASSILDLLLQGGHRTFRAASFAVALSVTLALVIYWPIASTLPHFLASRQLLKTSPPFVQGDVILYNPRAFIGTSPQAGDVVLYRNTEFRLPTADGTPNGRRVQTRVRGEWIDRVIAGPKSHVRWDGKQVWINGALSSVQPLGPNVLTTSFEVEVPSGACCIFPTTNPYLAQASESAWQSHCIVPNSQIVGKVLLRNYPFWRWWWFQ